MISPVNVAQAQIAKLSVLQNGRYEADMVFDQSIIEDSSDFDCYVTQVQTNLQLPARLGMKVLDIRGRRMNGQPWADRILQEPNLPTEFTCSNIRTISGFVREMKEFFKLFHLRLRTVGLPGFPATLANVPSMDVEGLRENERPVDVKIDGQNRLVFTMTQEFRNYFFIEFTEEFRTIFDWPSRYLGVTANQLQWLTNLKSAADEFADETENADADPMDLVMPGRVFAIMEDVLFFDLTVSFPVALEISVNQNEQKIKQHLLRIPIQRDTRGKIKMVGSNFETIFLESVNDHAVPLLDAPEHVGRMKGPAVQDLRIHLFYQTKSGDTKTVKLSADNFLKVDFLFVKRTN